MSRTIVGRLVLAGAMFAASEAGATPPPPHAGVLAGDGSVAPAVYGRGGGPSGDERPRPGGYNGVFRGGSVPRICRTRRCSPGWSPRSGPFYGLR